MVRFMRLPVAFGFGAVATLCLADNFRHFKGLDQKIVEVTDVQNYGRQVSMKVGNVIRGFSVTFHNKSTQEVAEIDIRLAVHDRKDNKIIFRSPIFTHRKFQNLWVPMEGSILPTEYTTFIQGFVVDYPGQFWRQDTSDFIEITEVRTFKGTEDLHQPGHLFTKLFNAKPTQALAILRKDPSLCKVSTANNFNATHMAFANCAPDAIDFITKHGGSLDDRTKSGGTILDYAPLNRNTSSIQLAIKEIGDINHRNAVGGTALEKAVLGENKTAVIWLLAHGAKPDIEGDNGATPSTRAILSQQKDILALLVKAGANPLRLNRGGYGWMYFGTYTPSMLAAIASYNVPVDQVNPKNGMTPLIFAASKGFNRSIPWLVAHGANINAKDFQGKTGSEHSRSANTLASDMFFRRSVAEGLAMRKKK